MQLRTKPIFVLLVMQELGDACSVHIVLVSFKTENIALADD